MIENKLGQPVIFNEHVSYSDVHAMRTCVGPYERHIFVVRSHTKKLLVISDNTVPYTCILHIT